LALDPHLGERTRLREVSADADRLRGSSIAAIGSAITTITAVATVATVATVTTDTACESADTGGSRDL